MRYKSLKKEFEGFGLFFCSLSESGIILNAAA